MLDYNIKTLGKEQWLTPPRIIKSLGEFDLDPCGLSSDIRKFDTAKKTYCKEDDGLSKEWVGRVWLNPPYGRETFKWVKRLSEHGNGIALVFARTETKGFQEYVFRKAHSILFLRGRLKFLNEDLKESGSAPAPSCLIAYGEANTEALRTCNLLGKLVEL